MNSKKIKPPLAINIFWNNENEGMYQLAESCYDFFLRNTNNPLDRYLGIPVYLYPYIPKISNLQLEDAAHSANLFLVDHQMKMSKDWKEFANAFLKKINQSKNKNHRIIPIVAKKKCLNFLKEIHHIRLYEVPLERRGQYFFISVIHSINRILFNHIPLSKTVKKYKNEPIKLFLSHTKDDGKAFTSKLRDHIKEYTGLNSFFDTNDLSPGSDISSEIEENIEQSILVAIQSDQFSSRTSCRKEVLLAKKYNRPVIVVNQLRKTELRSFPYIGNVPNIHFSFDRKSKSSYSDFFDVIILEALREALKTKYNSLKIKEIANAFKLKVGTILSSPPELLTLTKLKKKRNEIILYPDPPLDQEEINLLKQLRSDIEFITPTLLPLISNNKNTFKKLTSQKIAISLSEIVNSPFSWIKNRYIQDLMVEVSRYLLVSGAQLIYSGNLQYDSPIKNKNKDSGKSYGYNFSQLLIDLVKAYQNSYSGNKRKTIKAVSNFNSYPYSEILSKEETNKIDEQVNLIKMNPPKGFDIKEGMAASISKFDTFDKKYIFSQSLTEMRIRMIKTSSVLIVVGGKWIGFKGKMPGILEETIIALKKKKPVFLIGAFGGVTQGISNALKGKKVKQLKLSFYQEYYPAYELYLKEYNNHKLTLSSEKVDYSKIASFLYSLGKTNSDFGLNNGLSKKENERLFQTKNDIEILSLIFKGLKNNTN